MAFWVPNGYFDEETLNQLLEECTLNFTNKYGQKTTFFFFEKKQKGYYFPIAKYKQVFTSKPKTIESEKVDYSAKISLGMRGGVDQKEVFFEAISYLKNSGYVLINLPTNTGKTSISVYLTGFLKERALIVCSLTKVLEQWKEAFSLNTNAKICLMESSKTDFSDADVIICTPHVFSSLSEELKNIPLIICDEIHSHTKKILKTLLKYRPKYLVGLTATTKRKDGLHKAFPLYFGENVISRGEVKEGAKVYRITTNYVPEVKYRKRFGKQEIDYVSMVSDICSSSERNLFIANHVYDYLSSGKITRERIIEK